MFLWLFGTFPPFWYVVPRKIWQAWLVSNEQFKRGVPFLLRTVVKTFFISVKCGTWESVFQYCNVAKTAVIWNINVEKGLAEPKCRKKAAGAYKCINIIL
jgi:hypothetical protein